MSISERLLPIVYSFYFFTSTKKWARMRGPTRSEKGMIPPRGVVLPFYARRACRVLMPALLPLFSSWQSPFRILVGILRLLVRFTTVQVDTLFALAAETRTRSFIHKHLLSGSLFKQILRYVLCLQYHAACIFTRIPFIIRSSPDQVLHRCGSVSQIPACDSPRSSHLRIYQAPLQ